MPKLPLETSLRNPSDPLLRTGPERQKHLFEEWSGLANGFSAQDVVGAAVNVLVNAVRQSCTNFRGTQGAQQITEEIRSNLARLVDSHYDAVTGKRRSTFAHTQVIPMSHFTDKEGY